MIKKCTFDYLTSKCFGLSLVFNFNNLKLGFQQFEPFFPGKMVKSGYFINVKWSFQQFESFCIEKMVKSGCKWSFTLNIYLYVIIFTFLLINGYFEMHLKCSNSYSWKPLVIHGNF